MIVGLASIGFASSDARADLIEFIQQQKQWEQSLYTQESIFFNEYPGTSIVYDEYADQGVLFTDMDDLIAGGGIFLDGVGLDGNGWITLAFDEPRTALAAHYPGGVAFQLFYQNQLIYTSNAYGSPPDEVAFFGVISDLAFDSALILNPGGGTEIIDNLYFGNAIPAPGALAIFGVAALSARRRRRK